MTIAPLANRSPDALCSRLLKVGLLAASLAGVGCSPSSVAKADLEAQGGAGGRSFGIACNRAAECDDDPAVSSPSGQCLPDGSCRCSPGHVLNPRSGKCALSKGSDLTSVDGWAVVGELAAAARGDEGAVAYVEEISEGDAGRSRLLLQRFDASGTFFGETLQLASGARGDLGSVAVTSDGERYLVCWTEAAQVSCSALGDTLVPSPVFQEAGKAVGVVHGTPGWLIATMTDPLVAPAKFILRLLADDFEPLLPSTSLSVTSELSSQLQTPLLASTALGFLLVASDPTLGNRARLYRLDTALNQLGEAIDLGHPFWFSGSLAANANLIAVSLAEPYGSNLMLLDADGLLQSLPIPGGYKTGMHEALVVEDSRVLASWFTTEPKLYTQAFSNGREHALLPPGTSGAPWGASTSMSSSLVLVRVSNRTLGVYGTSSFGPASSETWIKDGIAARPLAAD